MTRLRWWPAALLLLALFSLTGCWDYSDSDERAFALAVAVDREGPGYRVDIQVPLFGSPEQQPAQRPYRVLAGRGPTPGAALAETHTLLSRDLELGHVKLILISERLARQGLGPLSLLWREKRIPGIAYVGITRQQPGRLLAVKDRDGVMPAIRAYRAFKPTHNTMAHFWPTERWRVFSKLPDPGRDMAIAGLDRKDGALQPSGAAVFRHDKLVAWLSPAEVRLLNWLTGRRYLDYLVIPFRSGRDTLAVQGGNSRISASDVGGGQLLFTVRLRLWGPLRDGDPATVVEAEQAAALQARQEILALLERTQALRVDLVGFTDALRLRYPRHAALASPERWRRALATARLDVSVRCDILTAGYQRLPGR